MNVSSVGGYASTYFAPRPTFSSQPSAGTGAGPQAAPSAASATTSATAAKAGGFDPDKDGDTDTGGADTNDRGRLVNVTA